MPLYISYIAPPTRADYEKHVKLTGYLGSYERYEKFRNSILAENGGKRIPVFITGDLGAHCSHGNCLQPSEFLCDYPIGNDKTCDAEMCGDHSQMVGEDLHYCESHMQFSLKHS